MKNEDGIDMRLSNPFPESKRIEMLLRPFFSLQLFCLLALLPLVGACSNEKKVEWTEDVKLSDGRVIVVHRANEYRLVMDVGAGFERGWNWERATISAELPSPVNRVVSWQGSLVPLVLDLDPLNDLYFVALAVSSQGKHEWKLPPRGESHVAFRWVNNGWERIELNQLPQSITKPNLFVSSYKLFITRGAGSGIHVGMKLKSELDADPTISRGYKEIIRSSPQSR